MQVTAQESFIDPPEDQEEKDTPRSLLSLPPSLVALVLIAFVAIIGAVTVVTRALVYTQRDLSLKERMLAQDIQEQIGPDNIVPHLGQLAFDASGKRPEIDQVIKIAGSPIPVITTLGRDFFTYVFTPTPPRAFRQHQNILFRGMKTRGKFRINTGTSGPTVLYELARIWELLTMKYNIPVAHRALPRTRQWWLYVMSSAGDDKK